MPLVLHSSPGSSPHPSPHSSPHASPHASFGPGPDISPDRIPGPGPSSIPGPAPSSHPNPIPGPRPSPHPSPIPGPGPEPGTCSWSWCSSWSWSWSCSSSWSQMNPPPVGSSRVDWLLDLLSSHQSHPLSLSNSPPPDHHPRWPPHTVYHERRHLESHGACCCESSARSPTSCLYLAERRGRRFAQGQVNNHHREIEAAGEQRGRERLYADLWAALLLLLLLLLVVVVVLWVEDPDSILCCGSAARKCKTRSFGVFPAFFSFFLRCNRLCFDFSLAGKVSQTRWVLRTDFRDLNLLEAPPPPLSRSPLQLDVGWSSVSLWFFLYFFFFMIDGVCQRSIDLLLVH